MAERYAELSSAEEFEAVFGTFQDPSGVADVQLIPTRLVQAVRRIATAVSAACILSLGVPPAESFAQAPEPRHAVRLEASYLAAAAYYSRRVADTWHVGGGVGGGVDQLRVWSGVDLFGDRDIDHAEFLHLAAFATWQPSQWFHADLGLRAAYVVYGDAEFSGADFFGSYVAAAVGWSAVKAGPRLQVGVARAANRSGLAVLFKPIAVGVTIRW